MLPGLGCPWGEIMAGSQAQIFMNTAGYAAECLGGGGRAPGANEDHTTMLQPASPCWIMPLVFALVVLKQTVAKKELEL